MQQISSTSSSKQKILRLLAVCATLVLIVFGVKIHSRGVNRLDSTIKYDTFFTEKNGFDVLFFGSSHVWRTIIPPQLYHDYGITSYNLGWSCMNTKCSYYIFSNAIRIHKPKIAVLDIYFMSYPVDKINLHIQDIFPVSFSKYTAAKDLLGTEEDIISFLFPYTIYHNDMSKNFSSFWNGPIYRHTKSNGYFEAFRVAREQLPKIITKESAANEILCEPNEYTIENIEYIKKFIDLCRNNDIIPVLTYLPPACGTLQLTENELIKKLAEENHVTYYNMLFSDFIDLSTDLFNVPDKSNSEKFDLNKIIINEYGNAHLNLSGAKKITDYIGQFLKNDFILEDHRNDPSYDDWNKNYTEFRSFILDLIKQENNFDSLLMACCFESVSAVLTLKDNIELDDVDTKLINQKNTNITLNTVSSSTYPDFDAHIIITDDMTGNILADKKFILSTPFTIAN